MGVKLMYVFALPDIFKQLCTKICFSSLDVYQNVRIGSFFNVQLRMHYLNFFLSCSIRSLTLASLSRLFTIKIDVFALFTSFNSHSGLFP